MAESIKRLHYFDHQFLRVDDFTDEQEYHLGMRRHHNRLLHTWGIAEGLEVEFYEGASSVTVTQGTAFDSQGREIVLAENRSVELSAFDPDLDVYVTIAYREVQTDPTDETGVEDNTRWTEEPEVAPSLSKPTDPGQKLLLARVARLGTVVTGVDESERRAAGIGIAAGAVGEDQLAPNAVTTAKIAAGAVTAGKLEDRVVHGVLRAWVSFDGRTPQMHRALNVTSVDKHPTIAGLYRINFRDPVDPLGPFVCWTRSGYTRVRWESSSDSWLELQVVDDSGQGVDDWVDVMVAM